MEPMDPDGDDERLARLQGDALADLERITKALSELADETEARNNVKPTEIRNTVLEFSKTRRTVLEERKRLGDFLGNQNGTGAELDLGSARREIIGRLDRLRGTVGSG